MFADKLNKEKLNELYIVNHKPMSFIAKELGVGETTVHKYLIQYGIPRRSRSEALGKRTLSLTHRQSLADTRHRNQISSGDKNVNWNGGISQSKNARNIIGITYWRNSVKRRDNFTCQECGVDGNKECECCGNKPILHIHHIKSWEEYPELRLEISNGITLCNKCHKSMV